jgi:DNA mismatch repair ATPase MutS
MEIKDLLSAYKKIKKRHPDYLILLRTTHGEFYECLKEDAALISFKPSII